MNLNERMRQLMMHLSFSPSRHNHYDRSLASQFWTTCNHQDGIFPQEDAFPQMYRKRATWWRSCSPGESARFNFLRRPGERSSPVWARVVNRSCVSLPLVTVCGDTEECLLSLSLSPSRSGIPCGPLKPTGKFHDLIYER